MRYDSAPQRKKKTWVGFVFKLLGAVALLVTTGSIDYVRSQQVLQQDIPEPPPLKTLSRQEKSSLDGTRDLKARIRTSISFAEDHLSNAERETNASQFDLASEELGK